METGEELQRRYESLWDELTREETLRPEEQRYRIAERLRRLNDLGFDADKIELISRARGSRKPVTHSYHWRPRKLVAWNKSWNG